MKLLNDFLNIFRKSREYDDLLQDLDKCEMTVSHLERKVQDLQGMIDEQEKELLLVYSDLDEAEDLLRKYELNADEELKKYWYNKYPKKSSYSFGQVGRIKRFCKENNDKVPIVTGDSNDKKAANALLRVQRKIRYVTESKEQWQYANETIALEQGDCEDGAILLYNMMVASGIPSWRIRLNCGEVQHPTAKGTIGHAYVTYLAEKDNQWYILDWCYWPTESKGLQLRWSDGKKYFGIWFSWNQDFVWLNPEYKGE